jgi:hypothetical protein
MGQAMICMVFDRYLRERRGQRFSRVIRNDRDARCWLGPEPAGWQRESL